MKKYITKITQASLGILALGLLAGCVYTPYAGYYSTGYYASPHYYYSGYYNGYYGNRCGYYGSCYSSGSYYYHYNTSPYYSSGYYGWGGPGVSLWW